MAATVQAMNETELAVFILAAAAAQMEMCTAQLLATAAIAMPATIDAAAAACVATVDAMADDVKANVLRIWLAAAIAAALALNAALLFAVCNAYALFTRCPDELDILFAFIAACLATAAAMSATVAATLSLDHFAAKVAAPTAMESDICPKSPAADCAASLEICAARKTLDIWLLFDKKEKTLDIQSFHATIIKYPKQILPAVLFATTGDTINSAL